ncbi:MAG: 2-oxoglutarate dehydrogenase complex dihydrolipoyllysine-residue succinyltransferase [Gammaproteobacteria bacterium]|nr:2-oxoglutarate dehydrogenase complex dihydrolipoyllysine-residue succinyltransferase [Gammaproteobacteria bacterium]MCI0590343.1 2-oxoglutarate dehydrogenase complex dihydrolipoyllysine-residue succinyltransferase [Gammaproteobacteria bacterium]
MLVEVKVPVLAESVVEATLMNWHKKAGDRIKRGDNLIDIETDKVTLEVPAPNDGVLKEIVKGDGATVLSDEIIAFIDTDAAQATKAPLGASAGKTATTKAGGKQTPQLSPSVRKLIATNQLDPTAIPASGKSGRLSKEDVIKYMQDHEPTPPAPKAKSISEAQPAVLTLPRDRPEKRVRMTRLRQRVAERLLAAQHDNAILTTFNEVNMQPVMELRKRYREAFEEAYGVRLGLMSFFAKATVQALKRFPVLNASVDGNDIIYHGYYDLGVAISSPRGLVVPIIRDVDVLSFAEIESKIVEFNDKARDSKLTIEDLTGGTFTITNGGVFGSMLSTPIINPPQSAILGMHKIHQRPVAEDGQVLIRPMMFLALSYDHRIIDGAQAVQFLVAIKEQIEDPARLPLGI